MSGAVGDQLHALGLQSVGAQGAHHIGQPLRPVAQSKAAAVFEKTGCRLAQFFQRAEGLAAEGCP